MKKIIASFLVIALISGLFSTACANMVGTYSSEEINSISLGCVSKVESMTAERKNLQNQKEIRAECRIFLYTK